MTPAEKKLWKYLRWKQLLNLKFRRQFWIWPYILDFYCPERRLCIELDGDTHLEITSKIYDQERTDFLKTQWIEVIRYTNLDIYENITGVMENIHQLLSTPPNLP